MLEVLHIGLLKKMLRFGNPSWRTEQEKNIPPRKLTGDSTIRSCCVFDIAIKLVHDIHSVKLRYKNQFQIVTFHQILHICFPPILEFTGPTLFISPKKRSVQIYSFGDFPCSRNSLKILSLDTDAWDFSTKYHPKYIYGIIQKIDWNNNYESKWKIF